jgi:hypothetical protein
MNLRRSKAALAALLAGVAIGAPALWPATGQESPESLLPPGFDSPVPPPPPEAPRAPTPILPPTALATPGEEPMPGEEGEEEEEAEAPKVFELPDEARRPVDMVGAIRGYGAGAFGTAHGRYLSVLMRRVDAPIASRWASIMLRRALVSRLETPAGVSPADWIAERAWLLLRMGEADAARMLVQAVDVDRFTPKMYAVAAQVALATADPAGLCPLTQHQLVTSKEPAWPLAEAMCAALSGDTAMPSVIVDRVRQRNQARGVDLLLAEKVVGAGTNSRRAVNVEWEGVDRLTAWRYGLAAAVGLTIPEPLYDGASPQVRAWQARAPLMSAADRAAHARIAAALGVFSSASLVDLYGAMAEESDDYGTETTAGRLRAAYVGDDQEARLAAIRGLWEEGKGERDRYATLILTAQAAARVAPSADYAADAGKLIAAMFAAGLDRQAMRWAAIADAADNGDMGWAILAVGAPRAVVDLRRSRVAAFADDAEPHKGRMLIAALAGIGRLSAKDQQQLAEDYQLALDGQNRWTRALDRAAAAREAGTVALLVAAGLQTPDWRGVPPAHLYRALIALRRVGLTGEARMIAAEAMSRL